MTAASYPAGTIVRSSASFADPLGRPGDPVTVTATVLYVNNQRLGASPIAVTRDGIGAYHCAVPTLGWTGPGNQAVVVVFTGSGAIDEIITDTFFVTPDAGTATDAVGP